MAENCSLLNASFGGKGEEIIKENFIVIMRARLFVRLEGTFMKVWKGIVEICIKTLFKAHERKSLLK